MRPVQKCLFLLLGLSLAPRVAQGQDADFQILRLETELVESPVEVGVLLPPGYSQTGGPYPLVLFLHGGGGSWDYLAGSGRVIEGAWAREELPHAVFATPATGRSFYMDFRDGSELWETFILSELLPHLRQQYPLREEAGGTIVSGLSMGGVGALRLAFKYPDVFGAVAALAPAIEPALHFRDIEPTDRLYMSDEYYERYFGSPVDESYWEANHPLSLAQAGADELGTAGLQIYLEVGDLDQFNLFRGGEALHRILFDHGIEHEYRLVRGVGHVGDFQRRLLDAVGFIGRYLAGRLGPA